MDDPPSGLLPAAGIYCCVPRIDDHDQSTVDRRELRCRDYALAGRPHGGGRRPFGYEVGMGALIPAESKVVREIFSRFLEGETLRAIASDLNVREVPTSLGSVWTVGGVARVLDAPRYAGIRV